MNKIQYQKEYYLKNRQRLSALKAIWYQKNKKRIAILHARYSKEHREEINEKRKSYPSRKKRYGIRNYKKEYVYRPYSEKYKEKQKVRRKVRQAIAMGRLTRLPCRECGLLAEAHHPDYSQPLNVIWLCRKHHTALHKKKVF